MWAYGKWEEAESLRYIPINQTMEIKGVQRDIASHYACNDRCYKRYGDPALPRHGHLVRYTRYCSHSAISSSKDIPHVRELQAKKKTDIIAAVTNHNNVEGISDGEDS